MAVIDLDFVALNIDDVLQTFDCLKVYRSDTGVLGPYIEITTPLTRVPLVAKKLVYPYQDTLGSETSFYKCTFYNSATTLESSQSDPQQGAGDPALRVISVDDLKTNYLNGLDMTTPQGDPFPDSFYQFYIKSAVSWLERRLDIPIRTVSYTDEKHDYYREDFGNWMQTHLHHFPAISVDAMRLVMPGEQLLLNIPLEWVHLDGDTGVVQVLPGPGGLSSGATSIGVQLIPGLHAHRRIPNVIRVDYTAGFVDGVPDEIAELAGKIASFGPLNLAGDLIGGAGISSQSLSIDGLSQSINTTSSPMYGGYGGRLAQYAKEIQDKFGELRRYYKGIGFRAG